LPETPLKSFKLENWISDNIAIIAGAAVGMAVVQFIIIAFACLLDRRTNPG
jgi:hypothetical protein